jgi:nickel/cobalt transporter (NicO) family protein
MKRHHRSLIRLAAVAVMAAAGVFTSGGSASAHPLGNFTTNTSLVLRVHPDRVGVSYSVDFAEIPALRQRQALGSNARSPSGLKTWADAECQKLGRGLRLSVDQATSGVVLGTSAVAFLPGQAGLDTLRLDCVGEAIGSIKTGAIVRVEDNNFEDLAGWREIVAPGAGTTAKTALPSRSATNSLKNYTAAGSPTRMLSAELKVIGFDSEPVAGNTSRAPKAVNRVSDGLSARFQSLVSRESLTFGFVIGALLLAVVLGAGHALAPGHGKSLMAAYVIGRRAVGAGPSDSLRSPLDRARGGRKDLVLIGFTVALTHTFGVLLLSALATLTSAFAPERSIGAIGVVSGVLVMLVGLNLLRTRLKSNRAHRHGADHRHDPDPDHDHDHRHHDHHDHHDPKPKHDPDRWIVTEHRHGGSSHNHVLPKPGVNVARKELVMMGLAGGLVPSPSALLVLLAAIALNRLWFGIVLVIAYGCGLGLTLIGAGLLMARLEGRLRSWMGYRSAGRFSGGATLVLNALPLLSACALVGGGALVVFRAFP